MKKIGRNDPCPCGSGKKYKRCCLGKDSEVDRQSRLRQQTMELALAWLLDRYGPQAQEESVEFFFESWEYFEHMDDLPGPLRRLVGTNSLEWLVAEAWITVGEVRRSVLSVVLEGLGPQLTDEQRQWLEKTGEHAIGLYRVREVPPGGTAFWLEDRIDPQRPLLKVVEPALAKEIEAKVTLGARLLPVDDHWVMTSAFYPFMPSRLEDLEESIRELPEELAADPEAEEALLPWEYGAVIVQHWLAQTYDGVVDPEDLDPFLYVDHYRVDDWERLAAALAAEDDVEGDRTGGWTRFHVFEDDEEEVEDEDRTWRLALNPGGDDRLDAVSTAEEFAAEDREWLARVAGDAVTLLDGEEIDDMGEDAELGEEYWDLPPAEKTARMQAFLEDSYRGWASRPLPYLAGKPPLLAVRTDEGRADVVELLRRYEESERVLASEDEREPASYRFLWKAVGLDRDAELRD